MTVFDFLLGIKRVDDKCYDTFSPYYAAKEKLKPCAKRQIYRLAPINKLDVSKIKTLFL